MKKFIISIFLCFLILVVSSYSSHAQISYVYPLSSGFQATQPEAPDLIQIPNNSGLTGEFVTREVPETTCGQTGNADGYFFEDDAGLQFNNPEGFIDQSYSIAFNFQIDEFITPPPWVRIISFTHVDDHGVYIQLTSPPEYGTLEFWPNGTVGETDFFSPTDFYQIILVRNEVGLINIYVNGTEFAEYDDSGTQSYLPQDPDNFIIWFRDDPSVLANEASPGFVSDIVLANFPWTTQQVADKWEEFCSDLLSIEEQEFSDWKISPNPSQDFINISLPSNLISEIEILDIFGKICTSSKVQQNKTRVDVASLNAGVYFVRIKTKEGKVSVKKFTKN